MKAVVLGLVASALAGPAFAQIPATGFSGDADDCRKSAVTEREAALLDRTPYAVLWSSGALAHDCRIIAFYDATPKRDAAPRIWISQQYTRLGGETRRMYADTKTCRATISAAHALEDFRPLSIKLPALNPTDRVIVTADGADYGLWSNEVRAEPGASNFVLDVEGGNYPGLGEVIDKVVPPLRVCMSNAAPVE